MTKEQIEKIIENDVKSVFDEVIPKIEKIFISVEGLENLKSYLNYSRADDYSNEWVDNKNYYVSYYNYKLMSYIWKQLYKNLGKTKEEGENDEN